jgi:predicted enzyme related to lactoylglutathione lyase
MIDALSFVSIVVNDQDAALDYYTYKLGFEKRGDRAFKGLPRFLTVAPKGQTEPEIVLVKTGASSIKASPGGHTGLVFRTDDCRTDYTTLKERGVKFIGEPMEMPFGVQALISDLDGNLFFLAESRIRLAG